MLRSSNRTWRRQMV